MRTLYSYFSAIVAMTLMAILFGAIMTAMSRMRNINRKACARLLILVGLMVRILLQTTLAFTKCGIPAARCWYISTRYYEEQDPGIAVHR